VGKLSEKPIWWIIQVVRGVYSAHGPFYTKQGMQNRFSQIRGGEVSEFYNPGCEDHSQAIRDFKFEKYVRKGVR